MTLYSEAFEFGREWAMDNPLESARRSKTELARIAWRKSNERIPLLLTFDDAREWRLGFAHGVEEELAVASAA